MAVVRQGVRGQGGGPRGDPGRAEASRPTRWPTSATTSTTCPSWRRSACPPPRATPPSRCAPRPSWCSRPAGGQGCLREFVEAILKARGDWDRVTAGLRIDAALSAAGLTDTALLAVLRGRGGGSRGRPRLRPRATPRPARPPRLPHLAPLHPGPALPGLGPALARHQRARQGGPRGPGRGGRAAGAEPPAARDRPGGAGDPDPPGPAGPRRPDPRRAGPRPGQPGRGLPQGRLPRPGDQAFEEALAFDPNNIYALMGQRKVYEDQRQWREAYEVQTRLSRLRKTDDGSCSATCRRRWATKRAPAGRRGGSRGGVQDAALALDRRVFPAYLGLADLYLRARAGARGRRARGRAAHDARARLPRLRPPGARLRRPRRARALRGAVRAPHPRRTRATGGRASPSPATSAPAARHDEAYGLLLRALEANPQALLRAPRAAADPARAREPWARPSSPTSAPRSAPSSTPTPTSARRAAIAPTTCSGAARTATSGTRSWRSGSARWPRGS